MVSFCYATKERADGKDICIDADTKLVASFHVAGRDSEAAMTFMDD